MYWFWSCRFIDSIPLQWVCLCIYEGGTESCVSFRPGVYCYFAKSVVGVSVHRACAPVYIRGRYGTSCLFSPYRLFGYFAKSRRTDRPGLLSPLCERTQRVPSLTSTIVSHDVIAYVIIDVITYVTLSRLQGVHVTAFSK